MRHGKRLRAAYESIDHARAYPLAEAIRLVKANATAKFDEGVEIAVGLGVDPRHADQNVRGVVSLPSGTGRDVRVAVIAKDANGNYIRTQSGQTDDDPRNPANGRQAPVPRHKEIADTLCAIIRRQPDLGEVNGT